MSSYVSFKDAVLSLLLSGVIYEYYCPGCNCRYIGLTYRYWEKRQEEHLHMLALKGKPPMGPQTFAPMLHAKEQCCVYNRSKNFHIIGK